MTDIEEQSAEAALAGANVELAGESDNAEESADT